ASALGARRMSVSYWATGVLTPRPEMVKRIGAFLAVPPEVVRATLALLALAALAVGTQKEPASSRRAASPPPSPKSPPCPPAWPGRRPPPPTGSWPGPAGGAPIRPSPASAIGNADFIACA